MRFRKQTTFYCAAFLLVMAAQAFAEVSEDGSPEEQENVTTSHAEPAPPASSSPTIYLRVGQRYPLEGLLTQSVRIAPSSVASAHQTAEGTLLVGKQPGAATMTVEAEGKQLAVRVVVRESPAQSQGPGPWNATLSELRGLAGVQISKLGAKTLLQGEILGRSAYQRVLLHMRNFPASLLVLAVAGPGIKASLVEQAQGLLRNRSLENVYISNAGNRFFLEGSVASPQEVEQALEIAQSVIPNIENHVAIPLRIDPTISVRVFILELSRQAHRALGLSWPGSAPQALTVTLQNTVFAPSWVVSLQHLSAKGEARVLAEPLLALKSGSEAELTAGGEIPIRITGKFENKVVWKNYGLRIRIQIPGIAGKHIRTRIETESSQLDEATAVDGVPGMRSSRMRTEVDALENQPVLLTGLFRSGVAKDVEKIPVLGSIPLLGELFKSRRFREHESELLVALLPSFGAQTTRVPLQSARGLDFDARWRILD